jgi:hypothetical protein
MRGLKVLCGAVAMVAFLAPGAHADEWNKRTYLTFSGPVQIPGVTLPAGTYTFEIANPDTTRHVIRVSEKDTNKPIGLFMTIPNQRLEAPDDNLIMFAERPAGTPQAIQVWFYPGDRIGEEFVYPKSQAVAIAKANHRDVLATNDETNKNASEADRMAAMKSAEIGRVDENGQMKSDESKTATTTTTTTEPTTAAPPNTATGSRPSAAASQTAQAETTPRTTTAPAPRTSTARPSTAVGTSGQANQNNRRTELPRTASNLVLYELLSVLALGGAFGVRKLRHAMVR